ncbi:MAG: archaeosortase/exosortase family protein [Syntrophothermus sp.]
MNVQAGNIIKKYKELSDKYFYIKDIAIFVFLTFVIHYVYRFWMIQYDFRILGIQVITPGLEAWFARVVFLMNYWIMNLFSSFTVQDNVFVFANGYSLEVTFGCSGIKQILQFVVLMMIFPGPWKHKLWYIPMGAVIVFLVNVLRILLLCVVMNYLPRYFNFTHDYPLRVIFYVVIFILWGIWNEKFNRKGFKTQS